VKIEEADLMDVEGERSTDGTEPPIHAPSTPDHLSRIGYGVVLVNDAKVIQSQMEAVQMLIIALKGRTDEYSMASRAGLETDLHALRVRKTRLKPLEDQNAILEALVEKRTTHFSQTEHNVQNAIAEMEAAKQSLLVAQQQLIEVRTLKSVEEDRKSVV
jgi:C4-dicarboxylate-specific signal transduction histidine kinase